MDYEKQSSHTLLVQVTDNGNAGSMQWNVVPVEVTVQDADEFPPTFVPAFYQV